jgi:hypothetical protein
MAVPHSIKDSPSIVEGAIKPVNVACLLFFLYLILLRCNQKYPLLTYSSGVEPGLPAGEFSKKFLPEKVCPAGGFILLSRDSCQKNELARGQHSFATILSLLNVYHTEEGTRYDSKSLYPGR